MPFRGDPLASNIIRRFALAVGLLAPALIALGYILVYGVNVPAFDEWEIVELEQHRRAGTLGFTELFSQHNEHRLLFPRLIMFAVAIPTHFNSIALMIAGWAIALGATAILFWEHRSAAFDRALFLPVPWLVFTLAQWENWLWGWQLQIFLFAATFVGAAAVASYGTSRRAIALGVGSAFVCTYAFASGAMVWPVVIAIAIVRKQKAAAIAFATCAALSMAAYAHGYLPPPHHPAVNYAAHHPLDGLHYSFANLGSAFALGKVDAQLFGALILATTIVLAAIAFRQRRPLVTLCFPASLIALSIGMAVLLTVGRSGISVTQALSSRYITVTILGVVGLYRGALALEEGRARRIFIGWLGALTVYGTIVGTAQGIEAGRWRRTDREAGARALLEYKTRPDSDLLLVDASGALVRSRAPFLEENKLSTFANR